MNVFECMCSKHACSNVSEQITQHLEIMIMHAASEKCEAQDREAFKDISIARTAQDTFGTMLTNNAGTSLAQVYLNRVGSTSAISNLSTRWLLDKIIFGAIAIYAIVAV